MNRSLTKTLLSLMAGSCLLLSLSASHARDIGPEQRAASDARKSYNAAKKSHRSLTSEIAAQEKRVLKEQAKLDSLRKQQADTITLLDIRKNDLDRKVERLHQVWDERTR